MRNNGSTPSSFRSGMTVVEMLVVMGLIAALAVLLLPTARWATTKAGEAGCVRQLRSLGIGFFNYVGEHQGKFPPFPASNDDRTQAWPWLIADYVAYDRVRLTPEAFTCPGARPHPALALSAQRAYSMNQYVADPLYQNNDLTHARQMLLIEEWGSAPEGDATYRTMLYSLGARQNKTYMHTLKEEVRERIAWRHQGRSNFLCKDGSIASSTRGVSGWGESVVWRVYTNGTVWRDGRIQ